MSTMRIGSRSSACNGAISDAMRHARYSFALATGFAGLLFLGLLLNWWFNPMRAVFEQLDQTEYQGCSSAG
jgi:hypothetical protein